MRDESVGRDHCKRSTQARTNANNADFIALFRRADYEATTPVKTVGPRAGLLKTLAVV